METFPGKVIRALIIVSKVAFTEPNQGQPLILFVLLGIGLRLPRQLRGLGT